MSDSTPAPQTQLAAISFDDELKAAEFMTAMTRLARDGRLTLHDAVFVIKAADGKTYVRETKDLQPGRTALGAGLWSGLFGLLLGGPVGMLVAGGIGAGAGAITAKIVDVGVTDDFVEQLREMVKPGTTTVALLAENIDPEPCSPSSSGSRAPIRRRQPARWRRSRRCARRSATCGDDGATTFPPPTPADGRCRTPSSRLTSQSATSASAITRVGRSRTRSSPGTPLRRPNSSARSAPM